MPLPLLPSVQRLAPTARCRLRSPLLLPRLPPLLLLLLWPPLPLLLLWPPLPPPLRLLPVLRQQLRRPWVHIVREAVGCQEDSIGLEALPSFLQEPPHLLLARLRQLSAIAVPAAGCQALCVPALAALASSGMEWPVLLAEGGDVVAAGWWGRQGGWEPAGWAVGGAGGEGERCWDVETWHTSTLMEQRPA